MHNKNNLIEQYRDNTLDLPDAESLRDMLLQDLLVNDADAAGTVAAGVLLIGVNALIERLARMGGRAH